VEEGACCSPASVSLLLLPRLYENRGNAEVARAHVILRVACHGRRRQGSR